jgi:Dolichyl-phosphate-mannose-protein mannosyltransferase
MNRKYLILIFFIALKFILQYTLINDAYDLQRDEYLHLDQANHLAFGFQSVPPFSSLIALIIKGLGNSFFWIKFFPALFGVLTIVVVWQIIEELKGGLYAQILGATALVFSSLLRLNTLFQPNSADVLFWTLVFYFIVKYINTQNAKHLIYLGIAFGIGFLNKYNIAFLLIGLIPALLITENRKLLLNKHLYFAVLIAFLIVLPNLIWQYTNDFQVVKHMKELSEYQLVNVKRSDFIKDQLLFFINSCFIILLPFYAFFRYLPFKKYQIIFWNYVFTLCLFIFLKAKSYYAIGLYPVLIAFGSVYLEHILANNWQKKVRHILPVLIAVLFVPIIEIAFPIYTPEVGQEVFKKYASMGILRWEDGKDHELPQDFADMLGWKELAQKVDKSYESIDNQENTLVLCDNYGQAGAINYYSKFKNINAVSMDADYINWVRLDKEIKYIILIQEADDDDENREKEKPLFEFIALIDSITHPLAREFNTKIYVLKNAKQDINKIIREDIEREKK